MSLVRLGLFAAGCLVAWGCSQSSEKPTEDPGSIIPKLPLRFGTKEDYLESPCGKGSFQTDLRLVELGGQLQAAGACASYTGTRKQGVFLWSPLKKEDPISLSSPSESPDQAVPASNGELVVDFAGVPILSKNTTLKVYGMRQSGEREIELPSIPSAQLTVPKTVRGNSLPSNLVLNMPKGIAIDELGNKYVAVSDVYYEGNKSDYPPGVVFVVNPQNKADRFYQMVADGKQYYNPVAVLIKGDQLIVKLAGALDQYGRSLSPSALLVLNRHTGEVLKSIDLGNRVVGLDGKIELSEDSSRAILSTADNSGTLLVVNLEKGSLEKTIEIQNSQQQPIRESGKKIFLSNVQVRGNNVYVANINSRTLYRLNWETGKTEEQLDLSSKPLSSPEQEYAETVSELLLQGSRLFVGRGSTIVNVALQ